MCIAVRAVGRNGHAFNATGSQHFRPRIREQRIAIVNQMPRIVEESINRIGQVPRDLLHPRLIRINTDSCNLDRACFALNDEEHHVPDGAESADSFNAEEVAGLEG